METALIKRFFINNEKVYDMEPSSKKRFFDNNEKVYVMKNLMTSWWPGASFSALASIVTVTITPTASIFLLANDIVITPTGTSPIILRANVTHLIWH